MSGRAKPIYRGEQIKCVCGNDIDTQLEDSLQSDVEPGESVEDSEEYECEDCGRVYKLTIQVSCVIEVDSVELEQVNRIVDADGRKLTMDGMPIGTAVDLPDGTYHDGPYEYRVENSVLVNVWNTLVTEDQVRLAI